MILVILYCIEAKLQAGPANYFNTNMLIVLTTS